MISDFSVSVPDSALDDLKHRLSGTRFPDELRVEPWSWGADGHFMRDLLAHWEHAYDWRAQEARLNRYRQRIADVDGMRVHFVHMTRSVNSTRAVLLLHGWPATYAELLPVADLLCGDDSGGAVDVVVPSIPGFGFSSRPSEVGWHSLRIADTLARVMEELGYARYLVHGGDIGAGIGTALALRHPDRVAGLHLNYIPGSYRPHVGPEDPEVTPEESSFLSDAARWFADEGAYAHAQRTLPQTVAFALNDSPAGLAAWIVEKFVRWSDCNYDVNTRFSYDDLLTNISIYWFTETIASSMRYYREVAGAPLALREGERVRVPTAVARFPREMPFPPRTWIERGYNVVRYTEFRTGGHFAAAEEPGLLAADIRAFIEDVLR